MVPGDPSGPLDCSLVGFSNARSTTVHCAGLTESGTHGRDAPELDRKGVDVLPGQGIVD